MSSYNENFNSKLDWAMPFLRTGKYPLDRTDLFDSLEDALKYALGDGSDSRGLGKSSYIGLIITVYENDVVLVYKIDPDRTISLISDPEVLSNYAEKSEIPTKLSQLENDADYLQNTIQIENGVYVVDINGDLHDPNAFTGTADDVTGIGLVTDNGAWIVALDEWYANSEPTVYWNENRRSAWGGYHKFVTGCWGGLSGYLNDFDGETNTDAIIAQLKGTTDNNSYYTGAPAAEYCRSYSKGYKDVGSWYLPAAGELNEIALNKDAINTILTKLGKNSISKNSTWSSSLYDNDFAWYYYWEGSYWSKTHKYNGIEVRPVAKLEKKTIKRKN